MSTRTRAAEQADLLAFDIGTVQSLVQRAPVARAALQAIHFDLLVQEVERRGWRVCMNSACGVGVPVVFPPMGDEDLPFDGSDQRP